MVFGGLPRHPFSAHKRAATQFPSLVPSFSALLSLSSLPRFLYSPFHLPPSNPTHPPPSGAPTIAGTLAPVSPASYPDIDHLRGEGRSLAARDRERSGVVEDVPAGAAGEESRAHVGGQRQAAGGSEDSSVAAPALRVRRAVAAALRRPRRLPPLPRRTGCRYLGWRRH
jgi:hypothetical protein